METYNCADHGGHTCLTTLAHCFACLALIFSIFSFLSAGSNGRLPPPVSIRNYGRSGVGGWNMI